LQHLRKTATEADKPEFVSLNSIAVSGETYATSDLLQKSSRSIQTHLEKSKEANGRSILAHLALDSRVDFEILSPGMHLAMNACAACAVAIALGVPLETAGNSVSKFTPIGNRSRLEEAGGIQFIDDTYNSNPSSLQAGLNIDALSLCKQLNFDMVGIVGPIFSESACSTEFDKGNCVFTSFKNADELAAKTAELLRPGDAVLVKGSRGMKMEMVANAIRSMDHVGDYQHEHQHS
jgi:UDP-N-acetylmuramyl pentapeptide synthase